MDLPNDIRKCSLKRAGLDPLHPNYRQHNPGSADGPEPFIRVVKWLAQTYPSFRLTLKRILAEGDLVVTHSHLIREPGDRGMAVVDI